MTKFKVGDKVALNQDHGVYRSGDIFTVTKVSDVEPGHWNGNASQIVYTNGVECFNWRFDPVKSVKHTKREEMKMPKFVETVTTTKIKAVKDSLDTKDWSCISVVPWRSSKLVELVIGAKYEDKYCSNFSKKGVAELIQELQYIHDAMED